MIRNVIWFFIKKFLFLFDAESAHLISVVAIRTLAKFGPIPLKIVSGEPLIQRSNPQYLPESLPKSLKIAGLEFRSRVGLAAGFDKNAEIITALPSLGFGFAEIGTVTPRLQAGNDRPRLFRQPDQEALFNRMGFNNLGATLVSHRLEKAKTFLPSDFRVGVNIGKNKDTSNDEAANDYVNAAKAFKGLADYIVINVSSPNTPGLRELQSVDALCPIAAAVKNELTAWKKVPPLFVKLAPELRVEENFSRLLEALEKEGVDGWVFTNTLGGQYLNQSGGFSGGPLAEISREFLIKARPLTSKPIISVGGILSAEEARKRVQLGADLIQIYTGWIYRGPSFPRSLSLAP